MNAIEIKSLSKRYKDVIAVNALSLSVKEGELFSLLGVNGAGKTTTIKMLSCLTEPTDGDALLLGKSIRSNSNDVKSLIAVSPQETAVAPGLSVRLYAVFTAFQRIKETKKFRRLQSFSDLKALSQERRESSRADGNVA